MSVSDLGHSCRLNRRRNILGNRDDPGIARVILFRLRRELERILIGVFYIGPWGDNFGLRFEWWESHDPSPS
jgi:hypothetical protein